MTSTKPERRLLLVTLLVGLWVALSMPIFAQEAYYWCYAKHPDLSYFDHPPMVAWLIWLGTAVFGDGVVGIRVGTFFCAFGTCWVGLLWLRRLGCEPWIRCGWIVCTLAMPMLMCTHFLTTPDPPLVFAWTLSMYALWRARDGGLGWWLLAGFAAGCALLSKYAAAFLAVGGLAILLGDPLMRRQWRRPGPYLGVLTAALTFSPVVVWNVGNKFESFRFQTGGRWKDAELGLRWLGEFIGGQFGLLHPVIAALVPFSVIWLFKRARQRDVPALWLLAFGLPMPIFFLLNAIFIQVKANWLLPCFLPLAAGVMWWWRNNQLHLQRPRTSRVLSRIVIGSAIVFVVLAPLVRFAPQTSGSSWQGWDRIAERAEYWEEVVDAQDGIEGNMFFFASGYRDAAQLSLSLTGYMQFMPARHEFEPVLAHNVLSEPALQFDHWEPTEKHVGQNAIYVLLRPDDRPRELLKLAAHFESYKRLERVRIEHFGYVMAEADIIEAIGYRGAIEKDCDGDVPGTRRPDGNGDGK